MPNLFLLFLIRRSSLLLIRPPKLLTPILPLFPLLSRRFLNLGRNTNTHLPIMWLPHQSPYHNRKIPQTSSSRLQSHKSGQTQWISHHQIECGNRMSGQSPWELCREMQDGCGLHLWRDWLWTGGGRRRQIVCG